MGFDVIPTEKFKKEAKRLIKKFPSLKEELRELDLLLTKNPKSGVDLGYSTFKIRLGIKSKGKGKKEEHESSHMSSQKKRKSTFLPFLISLNSRR